MYRLMKLISNQTRLFVTEKRKYKEIESNKRNKGKESRNRIPYIYVESNKKKEKKIHEFLDNVETIISYKSCCFLAVY